MGETGKKPTIEILKNKKNVNKQKLSYIILSDDSSIGCR